MSNHEEQDNDVGDHADLAGAGHEREAGKVHGGVGTRDRLDDDEASLAQGKRNRYAETQKDAEDSEFLDVSASAGEKQEVIETVRSITYVGPIPIASEMSAYDDETRKHILEMDRLRVEQSISLHNMMAESLIESDRAQSARQDALVQADIDQSQKAQTKTFVVYIALIVAFVVAVVLGQQAPATAIAAVFGAVSISSLFVSVRSKDSAETDERKTNSDADPDK